MMHGQYMMPLSPQASGNMTHHMFNAGGGHASSITPKTQTHASMHQR